jgi:uncharacterized protein (DUF302 family)
MLNIKTDRLAVLALAASLSMPALAQTAGADGIVRFKSAYSMDETVTPIRADIAAKGILFFEAVDQSQLAAKAGIKLLPSTLLGQLAQLQNM